MIFSPSLASPRLSDASHGTTHSLVQTSTNLSEKSDPNPSLLTPLSPRFGKTKKGLARLSISGPGSRRPPQKSGPNTGCSETSVAGLSAGSERAQRSTRLGFFAGASSMTSPRTPRSATAHNILVFGPRGAGKTSIIQHLTRGQVAAAPAPTAGAGKETLILGDRNNWTVVDSPGLEYEVGGVSLDACQAMVFVVDASDMLGLAEAGAFLSGFYGSEENKTVRHVPLLVFANKQDVAGAVSPKGVHEILGLGELNVTNKRVVGCEARRLEGCLEGFRWVTKNAAML